MKLLLELNLDCFFEKKGVVRLSTLLFSLLAVLPAAAALLIDQESRGDMTVLLL